LPEAFNVVTGTGAAEALADVAGAALAALVTEAGAPAGFAFGGSGATPIPRDTTDPIAPIRSIADTVLVSMVAAAENGGTFGVAFGGGVAVSAFCKVTGLAPPVPLPLSLESRPGTLDIAALADILDPLKISMPT